MDPETLLTDALALVESQSVRAWATTEHNRPIFVQLAAGAIQSAGVSGRDPNVHTFAAYIVATAIGL